MHGRQHALYAQRRRRRHATPLVVLVDGGTMSAAELLTGALQDRGRAVAVGSRTFGKGSVQQPTALAGGSVVELTVGHYRTPAGRGLDGVGHHPDLPVADRPLEHAETVRAVWAARRKPACAGVRKLAALWLRTRARTKRRTASAS